jgi:dolichyl-phosphate beta-glucosyltransferase
MQAKLSIVFPFYNEAKRISIHLNRVKELKFPCPVEFIYVNDGSTDKTIDLLTNQRSGDNIKFISYDNNEGKGHAVSQGIMASTGEYVLYTDFDVPVSPETFIGIFQKIYSKSNTLVISKRLEQNTGTLRKIFSDVFHLILKKIIGFNFSDPQCGFKIMDSATAKMLFREVQTKGFTFDTELLVIAQKKQIQIEEFPVTILPDCGPSTINIYTDPFKMIYEVLKIRFRHSGFNKK